MNVRFIDIHTGNLFDGGMPYTFWFPGEQSTGLIYSHQICFVSREQNVAVSLPQNDIFKLINPARIDSFELGYQNLNDLIEESNLITSKGYFYQGSYVHIIYLIGSAAQAGEYVETLNIGDDQVLIGADFYGENEALYINLVNNGLEIPSSIQKALYVSDVHEDKKDNILLNRKWKELLMNLWETVSNRGSYKSLFNSLKWFEYGDILKISEVWKSSEDRTQYMLKDIQEVLSDEYIGSLYECKKTTYMALSLAMQKIAKDIYGNVKYDEEQNPILTNISSKWSVEDLSIKMSLLGNFYQTYFMPIHLDLIHSTIENVVYSSSIKTVVAGLMNRVDHVIGFEPMKIKMAQSILRLDNVEAYVTPDTLFGMQFGTDFSTEEELAIFGVQKNPIGGITNDSLKTYASQLYKAPGAIAEFEVILPEFLGGEFVKCSKIVIDHYVDGELKSVRSKEDTKSIHTNSFIFNILCKEPGDYDVRVQFATNSDRTFIKKTSFSVIDTEHVDIKVYRILNNGQTSTPVGRTNDHVFRMQALGENMRAEKHIKYIPATYPSGSSQDVKGVRLNHVVILRRIGGAIQIPADSYLYMNYHIHEFKTPTEYAVCISKEFDTIENRDAILESVTGYKIHSSRYLYIPQFHHMEELASQEATLEQYTITDQDALCVTADLKFSKYIKDASWEFVNVSKLNPEEFTIKDNVREPFIAKGTPSPLDPGYYNIVFKYSLIGEDKVNKVTLESAFIKR